MFMSIVTEMMSSIVSLEVHGPLSTLAMLKNVMHLQCILYGYKSYYINQACWALVTLSHVRIFRRVKISLDHALHENCNKWQDATNS